MMLALLEISQAAEGLPKCVRPQDFSNGKFVASYEACLKRQTDFCGSHLENKECQTLPPRPGKPYYKVTVDDIDPKDRCKILKDGSYQCRQDPIKIVGATEQAQAPSINPGPSGSPAAQPENPQAPKMVPVPVDEGETSGAPVPVVPPIMPPPKK